MCAVISFSDKLIERRGRALTKSLSEGMARKLGLDPSKVFEDGVKKIVESASREDLENRFEDNRAATFGVAVSRDYSEGEITYRGSRRDLIRYGVASAEHFPSAERKFQAGYLGWPESTAINHGRGKVWEMRRAGRNRFAFTRYLDAEKIDAWRSDFDYKVFVEKIASCLSAIRWKDRQLYRLVVMAMHIKNGLARRGRAVSVNDAALAALAAYAKVKAQRPNAS